jgi:D-aminoacyl-tRNA deacylase
MICLIQRCSHADVAIDGQKIARIQAGLLVLVCAERNDDDAAADRLAERVVGYRVFADAAGRMNLSVRDVEGALLLVPQFTLAADTRKGSRPGFSHAAPPELGRQLFQRFVAGCRRSIEDVQTGEFGAHMAVSLTNDGPVTFWLTTAPADCG